MSTKRTSAYAISPTSLLVVHAIIPLLFLLWVVDVWYLASWLRPYLQVTAATFSLYLLVFELPHIVASFISYCDREYLTYYKTRLWWVPVIVAAVLLLFWYDYLIAMLVYIFFTMYHVIRQQTGITGMFLGGFSVLHTIWSWAAVLIYTYGFILMFGVPVPSVSTTGLQLLTGIFLVVALIYGWSIRKRNSTGQWYFWLTSATAASGFFFIMVGYPFLAIMGVRFVHDITAFIFYTVHDVNRNAVTIKNTIYQLLQPLKLPLITITPIIALTVAYSLRKGLEPLTYAGVLILTLGFVHYFIESFMWKRDSLHRQHITIAR